MTVYSDAYDISKQADHILRKQVTVALRRTATAILAESTATVDHSQRLAWARRVLIDPAVWAEKAIWSVLENTAIRNAPATSADTAVQTVCDSLVAGLMRAT